MGKPEKTEIATFADADGQFRRKPSTFRDTISSDSNARFQPERDRYVLYINYGCPWAHRANLVRVLKGLEEIIPIIVTSVKLSPTDGWLYDGSLDTAPRDPLYGFTTHKQLYLKADPGYEGRYTVPVLWDKKLETIVNNESSEIIRILYSAFDALLPESLREAVKPDRGLLPDDRRGPIEEFNAWVYDEINNGVYKTGFATTQAAYEEHLEVLFKALAKVEEHLATARYGGPYLFGKHVTEADVRLYTTMVRFDVAYYSLFKTNLGMIRYDFPRIHAWLQRLYWDESEETRGAFKKTTFFDHIKHGYAHATKSGIVPKGPVHPILPLAA